MSTNVKFITEKADKVKLSSEFLTPIELLLNQSRDLADLMPPPPAKAGD